MMKFVLIICILSFCNLNAQSEEFSLEGKASNIEDGTYLYLRDLVKGGEIDSALVQNNSFKFTTDLPEPVMFTMLFTKNRKNFKELWLEDKTMTFDASLVDFNNAKVTGSKNQHLAQKLKNEVHINYVETSPDTIKERENEFIRQHPDALVSAFILYGNRIMDQNEMRELFIILSDEVRESSLGQKIAKTLEKNIYEPGEKYADFKVPDTVNESQKISDLTGKLTLLQFWSSTCGGSRAMNLALINVYNKYHQKGLNIVSISKDQVKENWIDAIKEDNLPWPQLSNLNGWEGEVFKAYGILSTPSNILIDEKGIIIGKNIMSNDLENEIVENLK